MGKISLFYRLVDAVMFTIVFLFQSVVLNLFLIRHFKDTYLPFFWFLVDFIVLLVFYLTLYVAGCHYHREKQRRKQTDAIQVNYFNGNGAGERASVEDGSICASVCTEREKERPRSRGSNGQSAGSRFSEYSSPGDLVWFISLTKKFPMAYVSWILYSSVLIVKFVILFKAEIPQLATDAFFGPQTFKFVIGISSLIFSLIVAAHKNARADPLRNAYLNNLCYRIALEILDSASFISLLLPSESHLLYSFKFENTILILASINIFLPCMTLYKLCATDFGRSVSYPIELWYKFIHVLVIDGAFLTVRLYLWSMYNTDTAIFLIKNIYAIANFGRELPGDFRDFKTYCCRAKPGLEMGVEGNDDESDDSNPDLQLRPLNKHRLGLGVNLNDGTGYNWKKRDGSISTRGVHGSAQSSLIQVYATNSDTNGHALGPADSSHLQTEFPSSDTGKAGELLQQPSSLETLLPSTRSEGQSSDQERAKDVPPRSTRSQP